jgi:hypothetical protein
MTTQTTGGCAAPSGALALAITRDLGQLETRRVVKAPWTWRVGNFLRHRMREVPALAVTRLLGRVCGLVWVESALSLRKLCGDGTVIDYGVVGRRVVTTAGVNFLVDAFQNTTELENFKYHGFGTGNTAEAVGDTALVTELTTQYAVDNTRPTGSQTEGASANVYRTVGTLSPDSGGTIAIVEHGVFSATSAGTLWDRTVFSAVNLVAGSDSLQATYDCTFAAGS